MKNKEAEFDSKPPRVSDMFLYAATDEAIQPDKRKAVRKHWIERAAVLVTVQRVLRDEEISRIAEAIVALQEKEDTSLPAMRRQLTECEKAIDNMLNAIQMGVLTASTKERLEKLEMQREDLKLSILQAQMARPRYTKEQVVSWISRFKYGNVDDPQYQKQIIDTFINSIYPSSRYAGRNQRNCGRCS